MHPAIPVARLEVLLLQSAGLNKGSVNQHAKQFIQPRSADSWNRTVTGYRSGFVPPAS